MSRERYRLAPMDGLMWVLTAVVFSVPLLMVLAQDDRLTLFAFVLIGICGLVWAIGRPSSFEISTRHLLITWPARSRRILRSEIVGAHVVTRAQFRERYGPSVRVGVGGLFGQFGWAWTREGRVTTYVSTVGPFVLLEIDGGRSLLITPEHPAEFVEELDVT